MSNSNLPAVINEPMDFDTVQRVSMAMSKSGYFKDANDVAQAIVKVMAGQEMGIQPFAAMSGIHIINGKPALGANLIASLIKNDLRYDYQIAKLDDGGCEIAFFENGQEVGRSSFNRKDAQTASLTGGNWQKFPRNMYFARAISNGAKWYVPGIFGGAPVYTPDELGVDVDMEGDIIDVTPVTVEDEEPEPTPDSSSNGQDRLDEINGELGLNNSAVSTTAPESNGLPKHPATFIDYCIVTISRYDNVHGVKGALKLLGYSGVKQDDAERERQYLALQLYANARDAGHGADDALAYVDQAMNEKADKEAA